MRNRTGLVALTIILTLFFTTAVPRQAQANKAVWIVAGSIAGFYAATFFLTWLVTRTDIAHTLIPGKQFTVQALQGTDLFLFDNLALGGSTVSHDNAVRECLRIHGIAASDDLAGDFPLIGVGLRYHF